MPEQAAFLLSANFFEKFLDLGGSKWHPQSLQVRGLVLRSSEGPLSLNLHNLISGTKDF